MANFSDYRSVLRTFLLKSLDESQAQLSSNHFWAEDVFTRLKQVVPSGKLMRGSMVLLALESFSQKPNPDLTQALKAAAAMELFQTAVLIHDDIIDQDPLRRGLPSLHRQYQTLAESQGLTQPHHTGESLAICAGDIGLFLAFDQLAQIENISPELLRQLQRLFLWEVTQVGLAEMDDVRLTLTKDSVTKEEIESMYRYKTGRYSVYLPLALGALLAGADAALLKQLENLGETLGLLFQIKDDELGLFGSHTQTGKPVTSDAREGKKTLYYYWLLKQGTPKLKKEFLAIWGNSKCTEEEIEKVRQLMIESGAKSQVDVQLLELEKQALEIWEKLPIQPTLKPLWQELIALNVTRKK